MKRSPTPTYHSNPIELLNDAKGAVHPDSKTSITQNEREVKTMATVHLQGIYGQHQGTKVKDLQIGNTIMWNFGYKSEVVEMIPTKTGKQITVMLKSNEDGIVRPRRMGAERLVVVA